MSDETDLILCYLIASICFQYMGGCKAVTYNTLLYMCPATRSVLIDNKLHLNGCFSTCTHTHTRTLVHPG